MWVLQGADDESRPVTFRVTPGAIKTLGRAQRADFILDAALVSRLHCRFEASADQLEIVDLKSTNGTFVNDARVSSRTRLAKGDRVRIGRVELTVERG